MKSLVLLILFCSITIFTKYQYHSHSRKNKSLKKRVNNHKKNNNPLEKQDYEQDYKESAAKYEQQVIAQEKLKQDHLEEQRKKRKQESDEMKNTFHCSSNSTRLKQNGDNSKIKQEIKIPGVITSNETIMKDKLYNSLMSSSKFNEDFNNENWEDAGYVSKISEVGKRDIKQKKEKKQIKIESIKESFISDKTHIDQPEYQTEVEGQQFTNVISPVQNTPFQQTLWKDFHSSHYVDPQFPDRQDHNLIQEQIQDLHGNKVIYQKVLTGKQVPIRNVKVQYDVVPNDPVLQDFVSPIKVVDFHTELNKDIQIHQQSNQYHQRFAKINQNHHDNPNEAGDQLLTNIQKQLALIKSQQQNKQHKL